MRTAMVVAAFLTAAAVSSSSAWAATVLCPNTASPADREFGVDTTPNATCLTTGNGSLSGNAGGGNPDPFLNSAAGAGYVTIDSTANTTPYAGADGELSVTITPDTANPQLGTFTFTPPAGYANFVLGLQSGANIDPQWAVFGLPAGVTSGSWSISVNGLSHAVLYAQLVVQPVPLPGALALLLTALGALGFFGWRRKRAVA